MVSYCVLLLAAYQIVETTVNHDAYRYSTYMQYDTTLQKMKAGPHWDYDLSYGNCDFNFYGHGRDVYVGVVLLSYGSNE